MLSIVATRQSIRNTGTVLARTRPVRTGRLQRPLQSTPRSIATTSTTLPTLHHRHRHQFGTRADFTLATQPPSPLSSPSSSSSRTIRMDDPFFQQTRWKRKDGNRYHMQERKPTKKQRKRYNRQVQAARAAADKHGPPGSKAGARREWADQWKDDILNPPPDVPLRELEKYTVDDALLDDLMGNTSEAQPTPTPKYLGHLHRRYYNRVADQMEEYREQMNLLTASSANGNTDDEQQRTEGKQVLDLRQVQLPTDHDLSLALRAFRDRQGTRKRPIGIVKALQHLLQDVQVPVTAFGEMTYTTLLTCSKTPTEGRRIIQMMKQQRHPVSSYSWSILVDVYSKVGDYQGCLDVHREMIAEGIPPTLASFTSLLAACYKVCSDGRVSHKLRNQAAETAWTQWQEMRIVGIEPDVMAYGAVLRIMAARGKPERALNILEEMQMHEVAPTTLCFTSALRAVAKSHATAIRYEHGWTRRNMRREFITQHHGKLAQSIVRMAENVQVEQDDGFVAALISCAAAAGDLATAKAVYVANQIRRLDQFRTIGSDEHLARLRGEGGRQDDDDEMLLADGTTLPQPGAANGQDHRQLAVKGHKKHKKYKSYGEREYGKDSRILSAIMQACANASGSNMIGSMWQGRENEGYLCENSLRLINARAVPTYSDDSIPGARRTDNLTWAGDEKDLDRRGDKRLSSKFTGVYEDDNTPMTLDELDHQFAGYFVDEEGRLKPEYQNATPQDIFRERYGSKSGINEAYGSEYILEADHGEMKAITHGNERVLEADQEESKAISIGEPRVEPMHFNTDTMRWEAGPPKSIEAPKVQNVPKPEMEEKQTSPAEVEEELYFDTDAMKWKTRSKTQPVDTLEASDSGVVKSSPSREKPKEEPQGLYFDPDERRWKVMEEENSAVTKPMVEAKPATLHQSTKTKTLQLSEAEFQEFFNELRQEVIESGGDPNDIDEEEARELLASMEDGSDEEDEDEDADDEAFMKELSRMEKASAQSTLGRDQTATAQLTASEGKSTSTFEFDGFDQPESSDAASEDIVDQLTKELNSKGSLQGIEPLFEESVKVLDEEEVDPQLEELRALLPAFTERRLLKVQKAFSKNLGDPSILDLVKISREIMPDYVSNTWLKQMSIMTARYVMKQAIRDGVLDVHMLNGVLQLETSLGRLSQALDFHQSEFAKQRITPTAYSDRLVLQMFLQNNRFSRALAFKELVERDGRAVDLQSYGSLIDFCARRGHVGSAMLLLRECRRQHGGAQPGHAHLAQLRIEYRRKPDLNEKDLEALIGPDPIRWLKHGEAHLKREVSKKGRRDVKQAQNAHLRI